MSLLYKLFYNFFLVLQEKTDRQKYTILYVKIILVNIVNILFTVAPVCRLDEPTIVGASIEEVLRVKCEVQADPSDVSFVWQFNNSGESFEVPPEKYATSNGSTSEFRYTPTSERDYGTLTCWGKNTIGRQVEPCVYQLVPAGKLHQMLLCGNSELTIIYF